MMRIRFNFIKLAAFTGLVAGILHGILDIIARLAAWSFKGLSVEWFEFYQALLLSISIFTLFFIFLGIFIEFTRRVIKLKTTKKALKAFYFLSAASLLLLFYAGVILNRLLFSEIAFFSIKAVLSNLLVFLVIGIMYLLFLTKGKQAIFKVVSFFSRKKVKKIINKAIFSVIVFIILSFIIDLYMLNYTPGSRHSDLTGLEGNPNIIFISLTNTRADHLSLYGYHIETTPNIDRLSKDAVIFDNAISASSSRQPSQASIFTGKYPSNHGLLKFKTILKERETTLAEVLRAKGYNTVGYTGGGLFKAKFGFDQGFATYNDRLDFFDSSYAYHTFSFRETANLFFPYYQSLLRIDGERKAEEITEDAYKWLDKNKDNPFFMFLYYKDVHTPYKVDGKFTNINGSDIYEDYGDEGFNDLVDYYLKKGNVSEDMRNSMVKFYDNEIFYVDFELGRLFNKLDELNIKDDTIIIIYSVHGQEFFDHGDFEHDNTLYDEVIHVPLIIYHPKEFMAKNIGKRVSTVDILPTIFDILQIEIPENIDGISLIPLIEKGKYGREFVKSELFMEEKERQTAIFYGDWKLIDMKPETEAKPSALYNLRTDPEEQRNIYNIYPEKRKLLQKFVERN